MDANAGWTSQCSCEECHQATVATAGVQNISFGAESLYHHHYIQKPSPSGYGVHSVDNPATLTDPSGNAIVPGPFDSSMQCQQTFSNDAVTLPIVYEQASEAQWRTNPPWSLGGTHSQTSTPSSPDWMQREYSQRPNRYSTAPTSYSASYPVGPHADTNPQYPPSYVAHENPMQEELSCPQCQCWCQSCSPDTSISETPTGDLNGLTSGDIPGTPMNPSTTDGRPWTGDSATTVTWKSFNTGILKSPVDNQVVRPKWREPF